MRYMMALLGGMIFLVAGFTMAGSESALPADAGAPADDDRPLAAAVELHDDEVPSPSTAEPDATPRSVDPPDAQPVDTILRREAAAGVDAEDDESDRRRRWRSRRNRYPAPTFTPAEWRPPEGPIRIGIQAGHWRADEAPAELDGLRYGGTHAAGISEWEVNLALARRTGEMLEQRGYEVDILPAVVPPDYLAHLFIAIHADGADDPAARGYRVAAPSRDYTGRAGEMADLLRETYGDATGLRRLPGVTRRMRNYYAFNVRRYEHSVDPRTISLIIETGFLTSPTDRAVIVNDPDRVARGIADAVTRFPITALPAEGPSPTPSAPRTSEPGKLER